MTVGGAIHLWDLDAQEIIGQYAIDTVPAHIGFLANGRRVFVCCDNGLVVYDSETGNANGELVARGVMAAQASVGGEYLAYLLEQAGSVQP